MSLSPPRYSLEGKLAALLAVLILATAAASAALVAALDSGVLGLTFSLGLCLPAALYALHYFMAPVNRLLAALTHGFDSFLDRDYSVSLARRRQDELGELVDRYNRVGEALRGERAQIHQRELLLESVLQSNPTATVLTLEPDTVLFANVAARELLNQGRRLERQSWGALLAQCATPLQEALAQGEDSLFTLDGEEGQEIYHCAHREFRLNGLPHRLILIRPITRELNRQEVAIWKKLIRIISHELNNSLAPISSLTHSAQLIVREGLNAEKLPLILDTIASRTQHLTNFIEGYVRFARLPSPQPQVFAWAPLVARLTTLLPFHLTGSLPPEPARADPAQLEQVLINLLKNARESGSEEAGIELELRAEAQGFSFEVRDRGPGMSPAQMDNALLPFYSTKPDGSGLGLPLCREILEAHGGRLRLANREGGGLIASGWLPG